MDKMRRLRRRPEEFETFIQDLTPESAEKFLFQLNKEIHGLLQSIKGSRYCRYQFLQRSRRWKRWGRSGLSYGHYWC
ncbi:hypothetical protein IJ135_01725 [Candidatus Saccharibacteria bacterium]|nr:hypothetical protein [Candidatus Saccharibacteria bacterium]